MTNFKDAVNNTNLGFAKTYTENGMTAFTTTLNSVVDLFYTIGASRGKDILPLFQKALDQNEDLAIRVLLWSRDIRGGAGERQLFRNVLSWLEVNRYDLFAKVVKMVSELGRWDDLLVAQTTKGFTLVSQIIYQGIITEYSKFGSSTAAKWMPRKGTDAVRLRSAWGMTPKNYRKFLVNTTNVVETSMCRKEFGSIDFEKVPSVAMGRYTKAFNKHAPVEFAAYKEALVSGTAKVNAGAVYPYDVTKTLYSDETIAESQWAALPNWLGNNGGILPMVDISGSMLQPVTGTSVQAMDVAISLGLYVADKQAGPFSNMTLSFSGQSQIIDLSGEETLKGKINQIRADKYVGYNTSIENAFKKILEVATIQRVSASEMPKYLLILSDMEFDVAVNEARWGSNRNDTAFEMAKVMFEAAGYNLPRVIFWNLVSRNNHVPVKFDENGTALVSGFSPSILKSVLAADLETFNPINIVLDTVMVDRYNYNK